MKRFENIRLALIFKDFAAWVRSSCVGLNVAGYTTAKFLEGHGIKTAVFPVRNNVDVVQAIDRYNETHDKPLTHVVISAPWMMLFDLRALVSHFKKIQFVILSHSNVGFLQADPCGVELLRLYAELSKEFSNIRVGGNSEKFVNWFHHAFRKPTVLLPNLYPVEKVHAKIWDKRAPLKIGAFGAIRPEKNFMTAAGAAVLIHRYFNVPIELHMSSGGEECKHSTTLQAISQMVNDLPGITLINHPWAYWDEFIRLVGDMDLLMQLSYTESFNMVTADGISQGVSSVVSPVISWAPDGWKADPDDVVAAARTGIRLIERDQKYVGYDALKKHNEAAFKHWEKFLS